MERNIDRKVKVDEASEQVDVGRLKWNGRAGGWQPERALAHVELCGSVDGAVADATLVKSRCR